MATNNFKFNRQKTLGIEPKNEEKVFIKIPLENGGFWEREYFQKDLIGNVINDFKAENHVDIPKDYIMDWNCKNKSLKMTDPISTLLVHEIPTICLNPEMKKKPLTIQEGDIIPQVVGKPFSNPFEIFIFNKSDKVLKTKALEENIINNLGLNEYDSSSAYCNGNNKLFISGGENNYNEIINKLWVIDLNGNFFYEPFIVPPKKNHSMIFIPPGYVFVVGGNDKKTFYFDYETKEIYEWADLNKERNEPALQRIGSTLYCFDNINKSNNEQLSFEKTNLDSINPEWNLFYPQIDPNLSIEKLPQKFFGVSKDLDNNIIFLGGSMNNCSDEDLLTNYKYNPHNNNIEVSNVPYCEYNFKEKTFIPYNKNIDYILPDFNKHNPEVIFYVKNKSKIEKVNYRPNIKSEHMLRGAKKEILNSKYDFNMPTVSIPGQSNGPMNENFDINKYAQRKMEKPKDITINLYRYSINEPSFQEYNLDLNYKIEQPPPFKEPEIEPNEGDRRLSIEIPMDLEKNENEKKEINVNVDLNEEKKNDLEDNVKANLRYVPRAPKVQSHRHFNTSIYPKKNEYIIPKFHSSVNDPGNDLTITSKGKLYTSYIPREPRKIKFKVKYDDLNNKSQSSNKEILILPSFHHSVNMNLDRNILQSVNDDITGNFKTPNIQMPYSQNININSPDYNLSGNIPGLNGTKINIPSGNINMKGPTVKVNENIPNVDLNNPNVDLKVPDANLDGLKINSPDFDLNGKIPTVNINAPSMDLKGPNVDLKVPNVDLKGPNVDLKGPNVDLKGSNMDLKGPEYNLKGNIQGIDINAPKIEMPSGDAKLRGIKVSVPDYNLSGNIPGIKVNAQTAEIPKGKINLNNYDYNLSGNIPGINVNVQKAEIPKGKINLNNYDYDLSGNIPGIKVNAQKAEIPKGKINLNNNDYNLTGIIPGRMKHSTSCIDIKGSTNIPNYNINIPKTSSRIQMNSPEINVTRSRKMYNENLSGFIPGINSRNLKIASGKVNANEPDFIYKGDIPGVRVNNPEINIKSPNIDLKGPEYKLNNIIPGSKSYGAEINIKNPNINGSNYNLTGNIPEVNVSGSKLKSPNINIKGPEMEGADLNLKGEIPGLKINVPKVDIKAPEVDLKGPEYNLKGSISGIKAGEPKLNIPNRSPNFKTDYYKLEGNIPGLKGNNSDFILSGTIPSYRDRTANLQIRNYKIDEPNIKFNTIEPNFNIKTSHDNKLKSSINYSRGGSQGKRNFHGNLNDPNYSEFKELKGSRRILSSSQDNNFEIPYNKNAKKLKVSGVRIIDEKDVKLKNPYNINNMLYLQGQQNDQNRKSINLVVNKLKIEPPPAYNEIKIPDNNIEVKVPNINIKEPELDINKNLEVNPNEINLNAEHNNNINLGDINIKMDNKNIDTDNIGFKTDKIELEDDKNLNIKLPKIEIKNDIEIKPELPDLKVEQPKLESNIKVDTKERTDLRFRPILEDNKNDINININNENNVSNSRNNEENNSKIISGNIKKRGKGLPTVGIKSNNFQSSKIDIAGKLDVDNLDVSHMKSANVGVNGVKLGERIIE